MQVQPQKEHQWLEQLLGEWSCTVEASMAPGEPPSVSESTESVRSIGGIWTLGEGRFTMPDGTPGTTLMTLGYDPEQGAFRGTFVGSMMTHLWVYRGTLDSSGKVLTLDTEGPDFSKSPDSPTGAMTKYQDVIEIVSPSERILSSRLQDASGAWNHFMTARYRRK